MKNFYIILFALVILTSSCSDSDPAESEETPTNEIISVNIPEGENGVISIYRFGELDLEMQLFGTRDDNGVVTSVNSATLTMEGSNSKDYITYDDQQRVKTYHTTRNGINQNLLYKLDYGESYYMISEYQVNWQSGELSFVKMSKVTNTDDGPVLEDWTTLKEEEASMVLNRGVTTNSQLVNTSVKNTLKFMGGAALIGAGVLSGGVPGVALVAGGLIIAYQSNSATFDSIIDTFWNNLIANASASEIDWSNFKDEINPSNQISEVAAQNEFFNWCSCSVSYEQSNPGHLYADGTLEQKWLDTHAGAVANIQYMPGFYYPWSCDNETYYFTPGFTFFLKPGASAKMNVAYKFARMTIEGQHCGGSGEYQRLWSFSCPDN